MGDYQIIRVEDILRANIHPNDVSDNVIRDVQSLLDVLQPITIITKPDFTKATGLHSNVIQRLNTKVHALELLKYIGYIDDGKGRYVYEQTSSPNEIAQRERAIEEFQRFHGYLTSIKDGHSTNLEDLQSILLSHSQSSFNDGFDVDYESERSWQATSSSSPFASFDTASPVAQSSSSSKLPSFMTVQEGNEKTDETIRLFKQSIVPQHGAPTPHSYIRRTLLLLLFKQLYPSSVELGDEIIDGDIDRRVENLKMRDKDKNLSTSNEVYFECLIRARFDEDVALEILRTKRPNLQPPPEPVAPPEPPRTTISSSTQHLRIHWNAIMNNANRNQDEPMPIHQIDKWNCATHVVDAIIKFRQQHNDQQMDSGQTNEFAVSRLFRLIYSELSRIVHNLFPVQIEMLASALCRVPLVSLQHLNITDIRDIIKSCDNGNIPNDFEDDAVKLLSLECPICLDSFPRSNMEVMFLCNHICCSGCIKDYYRATITTIESADCLKRLACFQEQHEIPEEVKLNFFQYLETKLNQWFADDQLILGIYHENLFLATRDSQMKKCGNPRCPAFFDTGNRNNQVAPIQCPHAGCRFQQCQQCCRKWLDGHTNRTCEQYTDWLKDNDPDDPEVQLMQYLNTAGMICPNEQCKAVYEYKAGGCEHFTCPRCHTEFCRICSALFYNPKKRKLCPRAQCPLQSVFHAHCCLNCYREIRDVPTEQLVAFLNKHGINVAEELRQKPVGKDGICSVDDCNHQLSNATENRFCEACYKQFLCLFVWRRELEPWELYDDNELRQRLLNASVPIPEQATRDVYIAVIGSTAFATIFGATKKDAENALIGNKKENFRTKFQHFVHRTSKEKLVMSSATNTGPRVPNLGEGRHHDGYLNTYQNLQQPPRTPDQQTKSVVDTLKHSIQNKGNQQEIDESFIERELSEIIARQISQDDELERRRQTLRKEFRSYSDDVFNQALIFGCYCRNFDKILTEQNQKEALSPKPLFPDRQTVDRFKRTYKTPATLNLFQAVLKIEGDEINRAVRMFYSEVQRSIPGLEHYEINDAHEQVQAIRLTHYQSDDKRALHDLIQYHRTFDDAYSYLQGLAAKGATDVERGALSTSNSAFGHQPTPPERREYGSGTTSVQHPNATYIPSIRTSSYQ
ncbi:unnamed protein product [Adineta ricciae]|uniref:RING-type domain-containing protein n=1 Tax=Adineta ricciae TaxID=249248 RepID=A0A814R9T0_ADIRI|nr:unnamed protein product [Adineta ricciae]